MNLPKNFFGLLLIAGTLGYSPVLAQAQPPSTNLDKVEPQSPVLTVPARRAQGLSGSIVQVKVYPGFGQTMINFRPTGERVRQVTLGDSSKVSLNSDDPGCLVYKAENESEERRCNATVLYLRQINLPPKVQAALLASGLPTAKKTRLTVLTDNEYPYIFEIVYAKGEPQYSVVAIKPEIFPTRNLDKVRPSSVPIDNPLPQPSNSTPSLDGSPTFPLENEATVKPVYSITNRYPQNTATSFSRTGNAGLSMYNGSAELKDCLTLPNVYCSQNTRPTRQTVAAIDLLEVLARGFQVALERKTVPIELSTRIKNFFSLVKSGTPVEQSAQSAGISMQVVFKLAELGQSNFRQVTHPQPFSIPWVRQPLPQ